MISYKCFREASLLKKSAQDIKDYISQNKLNINTKKYDCRNLQKKTALVKLILDEEQKSKKLLSASDTGYVYHPETHSKDH